MSTDLTTTCPLCAYPAYYVNQRVGDEGQRKTFVYVCDNAHEVLILEETPRPEEVKA